MSFDARRILPGQEGTLRPAIAAARMFIAVTGIAR